MIHHISAASRPAELTLASFVQITLTAPPQLTAWELERAILDLPPPQQAVLRLRFYAGMSFREISQSLAISMNTAASRCHYALAALRRRRRATIDAGCPSPTVLAGWMSTVMGVSAG